MNDFLENTAKEKPIFMQSADEFLQFIYDLNVICYIEDVINDWGSTKTFIRWCFRERTLSNISPKVKSGVRYEIHYGLSKALRLGKRIIK